MTRPHDPRIDPHAGDLVEFGPQWQREQYRVIHVERFRVQYIMSGKVQLSCDLRQWHEWAKNADILEVAA